MATLILRDTHNALIEEMKSLDKLRAQTSIEIKEAASHGDLKENYDYKAAKEKMALLVNKKQLLYSHTPFRFVEYNEITIDEVGFGNKVAILEEGKGKAEDYYILGPIEFELDMYPMIVTYHSPFGKAVTGKKVDESFTITIKGKDTQFTIVTIEKINLNL